VRHGRDEPADVVPVNIPDPSANLLPVNPTPPAPLPWYRQRSPWLLMLGPAVVVVAGLVTAWLAIDTDDGLVVGDYYKEGKAINQVLRREQTAAELGLTARVRFEAAGHLLRAHLASSKGATVMPPAIDVLFSHPTRAGLDQTVRLQRGPDGDYVGATMPPEAANWFVLLQDPAGAWRLGGRWAAQADSAPVELVPGATGAGPARVPIDLPPGVPRPSR